MKTLWRNDETDELCMDLGMPIFPVHRVFKIVPGAVTLEEQKRIDAEAGYPWPDDGRSS